MKQRIKLPSDREAQILLLLGKGEKYGREIRNLYEQRTKQTMPYGSLYTTLDRMVDKGFIECWHGEAGGDRGDNRKQFYRVAENGERAMRAMKLLTCP